MYCSWWKTMSSVNLAHLQLFTAHCVFLCSAIQTHSRGWDMHLKKSAVSCLWRYSICRFVDKAQWTTGLYLHTSCPSLLHSSRLNEQMNPVKCQQPHPGHLPLLINLTFHNYYSKRHRLIFHQVYLVTSPLSCHTMHSHQTRGVWWFQQPERLLK